MLDHHSVPGALTPHWAQKVRRAISKYKEVLLGANIPDVAQVVKKVVPRPSQTILRFMRKNVQLAGLDK